jgi:hypothetical protein
MLNDIVEKYRTTYRVLESSANPKAHLAAIIGFFRFCEENNFSHLYQKFIPDFLNRIVNIFKNTSVDFCNPHYLTASKFILNKALQCQQDEIVTNEIRTVIDLINIRLLLLYYYLGEAENGIVVLRDLLNSKSVAESGVSIAPPPTPPQRGGARTTALVDPKLFTVNKVFDILRQINYELSRMNSFSDSEVNILLVESPSPDPSPKGRVEISFGIVQGLECGIGRNIPLTPFEGGISIENITDVNDEGINKIRKCLVSASENILRRFGISSLRKSRINLRFRDLTGIYKGTSFGAGAALVIPAAYLSHTNSRTRYSVSCSSAFTGTIDDDGYLGELPEASIRTKIEAAFFSWIKHVVVPEGNLPAAKEKLRNLQKQFLQRKLEIIGAKNVVDILDNKNIVRVEKDTVYNYSKKSIRRHPVVAAIFLGLMLIALTSFIVKEFIPKNLKPLPLVRDNLQMIYAPDRDSVWIFNNADWGGGDTVFFGEVGIGDQWLHRLELFNNGYKKVPIRIELQGPDKEEFDLLWGIDDMQKEAPEYVLPDIRQRILLKFAPHTTAGMKSAQVVFYNENERRTIWLRGNAATYVHGYSLKMQNDDQFYIEPKSNVLENNFTISFWFKINKAGFTIMDCGDGKWSQTKFAFRTMPDTSVMLLIIKPGAEQDLGYEIKTKSKADLNAWNFIAMSHKDNKTYFVFNDEVNKLETEGNHVLQFEDFFNFGEALPPIKRGTFQYRNDGWELYIAEVRFYRESLSLDEIFRKKYVKEDPKDKRLICYYDFVESYERDVFDLSANDIFGHFLGHPQRSVEIPPLRYPETGHRPVSTDSYVKITNKGEILLNKNLFSKPSSFTIQFDAKAGGNLKQQWRSLFHISGIRNNYGFQYLDGDSLSVFSDTYDQTGKKLPALYIKLDSNWHKYSLDYSLESNTGRFYLDGNLMAEFSFGANRYDISRELYHISFGKMVQYYNPHWRGEETSVDNVAIFNRILNEDEVKLNNSEDIKKIPGLLTYWTFSNIEGHVAWDEVNRMPIFLWEDYEVMER